MTVKVAKVVEKMYFCTSYTLYDAKTKNIRDIAKMEGATQPSSTGHHGYPPVRKNLYFKAVCRGEL